MVQKSCQICAIRAHILASFSNKANNDIDWRILEDSPTIHKILWIQYQPLLFLVHQCLVVVGGLFKQPNRFMYLGKSFEAIIKEHEIDLINYDKTMSDVDAYL